MITRRTQWDHLPPEERGQALRDNHARRHAEEQALIREMFAREAELNALAEHAEELAARPFYDAQEVLEAYGNAGRKAAEWIEARRVWRIAKEDAKRAQEMLSE